MKKKKDTEDLPLDPKLRMKRDALGIPRDKHFESETMQEIFGGIRAEPRNGLTPRMV